MRYLHNSSSLIKKSLHNQFRYIKLSWTKTTALNYRGLGPLNFRGDVNHPLF